VSGLGTRQEVEIKLRLDDAATGRRLLRKAGFRVSRRRAHEGNVVFDTPEHAFQARGMLLRLRRYGRDSTLTFKGPATTGKHKSRCELETSVHDPDTLENILLLLGFIPAFWYEKYRTEYLRKNCGVMATLDETPIGVFIELEGEASAIDRVAEHLGFTEHAYITDSYAGLYMSFRRRKGGAADRMVFRSGQV
jgi:adenylate cyclase class 2